LPWAKKQEWLSTHVKGTPCQMGRFRPMPPE
jgi:hypothetical protein